MSIEAKVMIGFLACLILLYVPPLLYFNFGWFKKFYHNFMHWHQPSERQFFDGCSFHTKCKWCGKEIMQDSQGNWFALDSYMEQESSQEPFRAPTSEEKKR